MSSELFAQLQDRLRHLEQYLEAARLMAEDARRLLEVASSPDELARLQARVDEIRARRCGGA